MRQFLKQELSLNTTSWSRNYYNILKADWHYFTLNPFDTVILHLEIYSIETQVQEDKYTKTFTAAL